MERRRPTVLIGPITDDPAESVSAVNKALMDGLSDKYRFLGSNSRRRYGTTRQSRLNIWNGYYLAKHFLIWTLNLVRYRPQIAHYAINAGWALWKGLLFLRIARWLGARTVGHLHSGSFLTYWKSLPPRSQRKALTQLSRLDAIVVLSESWRVSMITEVGVAADKLRVVNNPIDGRFEEAALEMPLGRTNVEILAMGVMGKDKGIFELVRSAAEAQSRGAKFTLHLAGPERDPGIFDSVQKQLGAAGISSSVRIAGRVHGKDKITLFRNTAISVLPSYYENFPLVLLEAAAAGHAIITTPVGAVPEFFTDGVSAIYVEIGDVSDLTNAIFRLATDTEELKRLGRAARELFCERLSRPKIMASLDSVYQDVLKGGKAV